MTHYIIKLYIVIKLYIIFIEKATNISILLTFSIQNVMINLEVIAMKNFMKYNFDIKDIVFSCHVVAGGGTPVHQNRPSHGIVFYTDGIHRYTFDKKNTITISENEIIYLPRGSNYTVSAQEKGGCYATNFQLFDGISFEPFKFRVKNQKNFLALFQKAEQEWRKKPSGFELKCKALLYNIIFDLRKEYELGYITKDTASLIQPAVDYIYDEFINDNIEISCLAELCNMSEAYFRRIFLRNFGISPIKYINNLKIDRAKDLITSGYYSISEAAETSGFHDNAYFNRKFKEATGVTPLEYKKSAQ